jgi:hypothetical protein
MSCKVQIEISAIKEATSYVWYKVVKKMLGLELRGKSRDLRPGDVIGLRPSTDGKSTRMVFKDNLSLVMSPTKEQVDYILKRAEPVIGGPIDKQKIGSIDVPKVSVKSRRINNELSELLLSLKKIKGIDKLKVDNQKLYFTYNNRPYSVVSDPS